MAGVFTAADNLSVRWRHCCLKALGLEDWILLEQQQEDEDEDPTEKEEDNNAHQSLESFQIINLIPERQQKTKSKNNTENAAKKVDPWMATALQIQSNLRSMSDWMKQKHCDYISLEMSDEEATLIQSTVTSFTATTANEIESLHTCLKQPQQQQPQQQQQYQQHCSGIVQILMAQLQQDIAEPWGRWQKVRHRTAVQLWQTPLQCRLWTVAPSPPSSRNKKKKTSRSQDASHKTLELLGLDEDDEDANENSRDVPPDQRFYPKRPSHWLHRNFLASYYPTQPVRLSKPGFVVGPPSDTALRDSEPSVPASAQRQPVVSAPSSQQQQQKLPPPRRIVPEDDGPWSNASASASAAAALEEESMLLQATLMQHNDLDSVQHLEQTMVDITTLLSQFANLVAEQQENVWDIADSAVTTKDNIEKGQENLQQATEATAASSHLMAKGIASMACLLLLLNWLVA